MCQYERISIKKIHEGETMNLPKDVEGVIFDLDGTLLDSSWVWNKVDIKFLGDRGFDVPDDYVEAISPMGADKAAVYTVERFGLNENPKDLVREWFDMAKEEYHHRVLCKPYAKAFIKQLWKNGIKMSIATSSDRELFVPTLEREGILKYFKSIVTVDEVKRGKEFPDIYEEAARRIDTKTDKCVVFEDIITGVRGAKKGNFRVVAVEDDTSILYRDELKNTADYYISSYSELLDEK